MATHNETGKCGEEIAAKYLMSKGYVVLERNYRTKRAEIDIIARHKHMLVLVEVRAKQHEWFGTPEDTINHRKRARLIRNGLAYMHWKKYTGPWRVDAVCLVIDKNQNPRHVAHYENIVEC
ncbi:MAG: YraN family protein [bacterium]|nr:YraN family protein [bacterium]